MPRPRALHLPPACRDAHCAKEAFRVCHLRLQLQGRRHDTTRHDTTSRTIILHHLPIQPTPWCRCSNQECTCLGFDMYAGGNGAFIASSHKVSTISRETETPPVARPTNEPWRRARWVGDRHEQGAFLRTQSMVVSTRGGVVTRLYSQQYQCESVSHYLGSSAADDDDDEEEEDEDDEDE